MLYALGYRDLRPKDKFATACKDYPSLILTPPLPRHHNRLTAEGHFQDVRHLEFDASGVPGGASYKAGDVAWVHPSNNASAVETLAVLMGLDLDQVVRIAPALPQPKPVNADAPVACEGGGAIAEGGQRAQTGVRATVAVSPWRQQQLGSPQRHAGFFLPPVTTLRLLLTEVLDISGTPRRSFFERLSVFASENDEKEKLEELASPAGADLLYEYATREKRSYVEVFGDFPSCKVGLKDSSYRAPGLVPYL